MTELIEFLRARLDEREQTARAIEGNSPNWHTEVAREDPYDDHRACVRSGQGEVITDGIPARYADHIAANDPAHVLADVDSKRRLLDEHLPVADHDGELECTTCVYVGHDEDAGGNRFRYRERSEWPCVTIRLLALPYSDHEDYREEWRP